MKLAVSVSEAAEMLSVSDNSVWELLRVGRLQRVKVGRRTVIPIASIVALLNETTGDEDSTGQKERTADNSHGGQIRCRSQR